MALSRLPPPVAAACVLLLSCRAVAPAGSTCDLNSDCAEPYVCALEVCRRQCLDSRDCGAGLLCLRLSDDRGATSGVCQLPDETDCGLTSDCTTGLVCRFGTCTTECVEDRDCSPGATCSVPEDGVGSACVEVSPQSCVWNSDCPWPAVCNERQQCGLECAADRDCDRERQCDPESSRCVLRDGGL